MKYSRVKMSSDMVRKHCNEVIGRIEKRREVLRASEIRNEMRRRNSGVFGWFGKLFNKEWDEEKAKKYCLGYSWDYSVISIHGALAKDTAETLYAMAKESDSIMVSSNEYRILMGWMEKK